MSEERKQAKEQGGSKFDFDKPRYDLLPIEPLLEVVKVFTMGAQKYGDHNWREGMDWHRLYRAAITHLNQFWGGEEFDEESGLDHLAHAIVNCLFLMEYRKIHPDLDDRVEKKERKEKENEKSCSYVLPHHEYRFGYEEYF